MQSIYNINLVRFFQSFDSSISVSHLNFVVLCILCDCQKVLVHRIEVVLVDSRYSIGYQLRKISCIVYKKLNLGVTHVH